MEKEIKKKLQTFCKENNIEYLGIFGSVAKGKETDNSDIDILVRFGSSIGLFALIKIKKELEEIVKRKVDLVTEDAISPHIRENVIRETEIIYNAA